MNIIDQAHADNVALREEITKLRLDALSADGQCYETIEALREKVKELEAALTLMLKANFGCGCCMDPVAVGEALTAAEKALGTAP